MGLNQYNYSYELNHEELLVTNDFGFSFTLMGNTAVSVIFNF